ncbi:MAG TPA: cytochrome C, partial [Ignavibacteria bacterium]|nr:cytochrome C [Ignavibacteria bacterium]
MIKKILKLILLVLVVGFIAVQFFNRPDKSTTTEVTPAHITKVMTVPANVEGILKRSCYDC